MKPSVPSVDGVLAVDKPKGPTSHDVVRQARKRFGTRAVGHAGTLDPMATGVLVLLFGEATKLSPYLSAQHKSYVAEVTLGSSTDTYDAEGRVVVTAPVPRMAREQIERALDVERTRVSQVPPAFSAIKRGGTTAHRAARRGEPVELEPRQVQVTRLELLDHDGAIVRVEMTVSKGYFVRSFAGDLGRSLDVPAHLSALRRTASGSITLDACSPWPCEPTPPLQRVADAARSALPYAVLTAEGLVRARHGKLLATEHFTTPPPDTGAWLSPEGDLVAVGSQTDEGYRVARGFNTR